MADSDSNEYCGYLYKWTNYIKGYQKRWFTINNQGILHYCKPSSADGNGPIRGSINLVDAMVSRSDSFFSVSLAGVRTFHLKASSEVEQQKWITAIELAKAKAIDHCDEEAEEVLSGSLSDAQHSYRLLDLKLDELCNCAQLVGRHSDAFDKLVKDIEKCSKNGDLKSKFKLARERCQVFKVTTTAMNKVSSEFVELARTNNKTVQSALQREHDRNISLQETVESLAKQAVSFERKAIRFSKHLPPSSRPNGERMPCSPGSIASDSGDEYHDALDEPIMYEIPLPKDPYRHSGSIVAARKDDSVLHGWHFARVNRAQHRSVGQHPNNAADRH